MITIFQWFYYIWTNYHLQKSISIADMTKFLNDQPVDLQGYDEQLVRSLIEKITVFDDKLTIEFKSCVEIDIEI